MPPQKRALGAVLSLILALPWPCAALPPASAPERTQAIKAAFVKGEPLPAPDTGPADELYEAAADVQKGPLAGEETAVFSARVEIVGEKLSLTPDELLHVKSIYSARRRPAGGARSGFLRALDDQAARRQTMSASAARLASGLGTGRVAEAIG